MTKHVSIFNTKQSNTNLFINHQLKHLKKDNYSTPNKADKSSNSINNLNALIKDSVLLKPEFNQKMFKIPKLNIDNKLSKDNST